MKKQDYLNYIKQFQKISMTNICNDLKINISNIYNGTASEKKYKKIYEEIQRRLKIINENR